MEFKDTRGMIHTTKQFYPIFIAICLLNIDSVKLLLEAGADSNAFNVDRGADCMHRGWHSKITAIHRIC